MNVKIGNVICVVTELSIMLCFEGLLNRMIQIINSHLELCYDMLSHVKYVGVRLHTLVRKSWIIKRAFLSKMYLIVRSNEKHSK
jgi:hypothetical protein